MIPPLLPLGDATGAGWQRKVRDAVNGMLKRLMSQGVTAERPADPVTGTQFYDMTLMKPVWYAPDGTWRDASGTAA